MALRVATLVAAAAAGAVAVAPATADAARLTHTVTIEGELVNHWSIAEPGPCGTVGDGTVTVRFKTTRRTKVLPYIDPFARALGGGYRAWIVAEPLGPGRRLFTDMGYVKATGTVTRVDNTVSRPPDPQDTEPCPPIEKDACGTVPLGSARGTKAGDRALRPPPDHGQRDRQLLSAPRVLRLRPARVLGRPPLRGASRRGLAAAEDAERACAEAPPRGQGEGLEPQADDVRRSRRRDDDRRRDSPRHRDLQAALASPSPVESPTSP